MLLAPKLQAQEEKEDRKKWIIRASQLHGIPGLNSCPGFSSKGGVAILSPLSGAHIGAQKKRTTGGCLCDQRHYGERILAFSKRPISMHKKWHDLSVDTRTVGERRQKQKPKNYGKVDQQPCLKRGSPIRSDLIAKGRVGRSNHVAKRRKPLNSKPN